MSDSFEHNPNDHEDPLPGPTWIVGILGAVLLSVIMLGLTALYYNAQSEEDEHKVIQRDPMELENLRRSQQAVLAGQPRIVEVKENEQTMQHVVIPIDQAMEITVKELGGK